jgi:ankyrin repeat protein
VDLKADLDLADPDGTTPLVMALMNAHWDAAKLLIDSGADVNLWDFWGQSPIYMAVDLNTLPTGARVELPGTDQATGIDIIHLLLAKGANPNMQLKLHMPLRHAVQDRQSDLMLTIGTTPLLRAAKAADLPAMRALLDAGALVDLPNEMGYTPLLAAAGAGRGNSPTRNGQKTEEMAIEAVQMLLAAGANVNARGADEDTVLMGAAYRGWSKLAAVLAAAGADLNAVDKDDVSVIDYALGYYKPRFLENKAVPYADTAEALRKLGATKETAEPPNWPGLGVPGIRAEVP